MALVTNGADTSKKPLKARRWLDSKLIRTHPVLANFIADQGEGSKVKDMYMDDVPSAHGQIS